MAEATPKTVSMPKTVHELHIGPKPEDVIEPGTLLTDAVNKQHSFDPKLIEGLVDRGAVVMVDVLKG